MLITALIFLGSLILVLLGSRWFISAAIEFSNILRLPRMVVGATLVSLVTTMPENLVALFAGMTNHPQIAAGNATGSVLVNLGLILGLLLIVSVNDPGERREEKVFTQGRGRRRSLILLGITIFIFLLVTVTGELTPMVGIILILLGGIYLFYTAFYSFRESRQDLHAVGTKLRSNLSLVFKFLLGMSFLVIASKSLVGSTITIAKIAGVSEFFLGLTIVALGTSFPEIITAVTTLYRKEEGISFGNLTGASIIDLTITLGIASLFGPLFIDKKYLVTDLLFILLISFLVLTLSFKRSIPRKLIGFTLVFLYVTYIIGQMYWSYLLKL